MIYGVMCNINFILRIFNYFIVIYHDMRGRDLQLYCLSIFAHYYKHAISVVLVSLSNESFNFICCYASSTKYFLKKGSTKLHKFVIWSRETSIFLDNLQYVLTNQDFHRLLSILRSVATEQQ